MAKKKIPKYIEKEINEFVETLKDEKLPISSVYLFGSFAKGRGNKWSDIDVCVVSPKFKDVWDARRYLWSKRVLDKDPYKPWLEPVGYGPKDFKEGGILIDEIKETGIRII